VLSNDGRILAITGQEGAGDGEFSNLHGLAVDSQGFVYVVDTGNYRIQKFKVKGL